MSVCVCVCAYVRKYVYYTDKLFLKIVDVFYAKHYFLQKDRSVSNSQYLFIILAALQRNVKLVCDTFSTTLSQDDAATCVDVDVCNAV